MRSGTIAFLLGVMTLQGAAQLPDVWFCLLLPFFVAAGWRIPKARLLAWYFCGVLWALWRAHLILAEALPAGIEGETVVVEGTVAGLPEAADGRLRFNLDTTLLEQGRQQWPGCGRVRLDWREPTQAVHAGERWRLSVRLKRPYGLRNPGGFDYEAWLYQHRIRATGYVAGGGAHERVAAASWSVDQVRERLRGRVQEAIGYHPLAGVVTALAIGAQDGITPGQWRVFFRTGTGHLIAISGLHIGLVAGFGFFLGRWLWSLPAYTLLLVAAPRVGALAGFIAAFGYSALAGFEVPTQRTLIMIGVGMAGLWLSRRVLTFDGLLLSLLLVLLLDPLAVLSVGFWLSFVAVAILLYSTGGPRQTAGLWGQLGRTHLAIAVGMMPLLTVLFGQNPILGPVANLVAVPWVSFVVVPLVLIGTLVISWFPFVGYWFLSGALLALDLLWQFLQPLAGAQFAIWNQPAPGVLAIACAFVGAAILLMPRGLPSRHIGLIWLAPLLLSRPERPAAGELWFTLLDVGQGLAVVARTREHVLVFDTGPGYSERFDTGAAVVVPYLHNQGVDRIDTLVVSHGDSDHIGGARSVLEQMPVGAVLSSVPERLVHPRSGACADGQRWEWDGVVFTILHPPPRQASSDNNDSCVLRIRTAGGAVLLPGDIEAEAERRLLREHGGDLRAQVLVAPHHGSKTSSTPAFVAAVSPQYVLYPAGYANRYGFPQPAVRRRYAAAHAEQRVGAEEGAVTVRIGGEVSPPESYRRRHWRYWQRRLDEAR